jgi:hypothetical protein
MATEAEHLPKLPKLPDDLSLRHQLFLGAIKELLEELVGRLENAPAVPLFQIGTYIGDGLIDKLIEVNFRPRYVKVWTIPAAAGAATLYERVDSELESIDWTRGSIRQDVTAGAEHYYMGPGSDTGITKIDDSGFYVGDGDADLDPNKIDVEYIWMCFG